MEEPMSTPPTESPLTDSGPLHLLEATNKCLISLTDI